MFMVICCQNSLINPNSYDIFFPENRLNLNKKQRAQRNTSYGHIQQNVTSGKLC